MSEHHDDTTRPVHFGRQVFFQARCACGWLSGVAHGAPRPTGLPLGGSPTAEEGRAIVASSVAAHQDWADHIRLVEVERERREALTTEATL